MTPHAGRGVGCGCRKTVSHKDIQVPVLGLKLGNGGLHVHQGKGI